MKREAFTSTSPGSLVTITGTDARFGEWEHVAYVPDPLPSLTPNLSVKAFNAVARARAALASLDSMAAQLPNPRFLRQPTLRREAQSTSALEGTFAPLEEVLATDQDRAPTSLNLREVWNYIQAAEHAFAWVGDGRPLTTGLLTDVQSRLVRGTRADTPHAHRIRDIQVMIGGESGKVHESRYVPPPPGPALEGQVRDLVDWISSDFYDEIDPVVAAAMAHYQFEALHPFNDGNGRIGRLLVVLHLMRGGALSEPTLSVSPWFETRRSFYYDRLLAVSTEGDWDSWVAFFASGIESSALETKQIVTQLLAVRTALKDKVRAASLRAESAMQLVDYTLQQPIFTVPQAEKHLGLTYARVNRLVGQLIEAGVLRQYREASWGREFFAPEVLSILTQAR